LNNGSITRITRPNECLSAIDLTFASPSIAAEISWKTLDDSFSSDHFPILMTMQNVTDFLMIYPKRRWNINEENLKTYNMKLESKKLVNVYTAKQKVHDCINNIQKVADESFKKMVPFVINRKPPPPWWDWECDKVVSERKWALREFKKHRTDEYYIEC